MKPEYTFKMGGGVLTGAAKRLHTTTVVKKTNSEKAFALNWKVPFVCHQMEGATLCMQSGNCSMLSKTTTPSGTL